MSADGIEMPGSLFNSVQAALTTPGRLFRRIVGGTSSTTTAVVTGDAVCENADKAAPQVSMLSGGAPQQCSKLLGVQENEAEHQLLGSLQQTLLQQTAGLHAKEYAALERFLSRTQVTARNSHNQQQAGRLREPSTVPKMPKNIPAAVTRDGGAGPIRRNIKPARFTTYGGPAAGFGRIGAARAFNSAKAPYRTAGKPRPTTYILPRKPAGGTEGPLSIFLQQNAIAATPTPQTPAPGDGLHHAASAASKDAALPAVPNRLLVGIQTPGVWIPTNSLFGIAANNSRNATPCFPATANIQQSAAATEPDLLDGLGLTRSKFVNARPSSRFVSGGFGSSGGELGSNSINKDLPGLVWPHGISPAPKPVLGLPRPRSKASEAPSVMGPKRGVAGRQGKGLSNHAVVAGDHGASEPTGSNIMSLKLGLPAPGLKRRSDMQGPSVLDKGIVGHKRVRLATTAALTAVRAMSGLGTSLGGSTGTRDGSSGSRTLGLQAAAAAVPDDDVWQQEFLGPVVPITRVAETIMDTMRSFDKGDLKNSALYRNHQQQPQSPAVAAPLAKVTPNGVTLSTFDATPCARKPPAAAAGAAAPAAPGSVAANKFPGSLFKPVSAAADILKMPHFPPVPPCTAGACGDDAFGTSLSAESSQQQQERAAADKAFGTHMIGSNPAVPKWGTTPAAAAGSGGGGGGGGGGADSSKVAAAGLFESPVIDIDDHHADANHMVLPPGCDPSLLTDELKTTAAFEVPFPDESEEEDDHDDHSSSSCSSCSSSSIRPEGMHDSQQQDVQEVDSGDKQHPPVATEDGNIQLEEVVAAASTAPAANLVNDPPEQQPAEIKLASETDNPIMCPAKRARQSNRFSVWDMENSSDEEEEEEQGAPEPQAKGRIDEQQQQQRRSSRLEQLKQQEEDTADRKRKKRVSFTPSMASGPETTATGSPAARRRLAPRFLYLKGRRYQILVLSQQEKVQKDSALPAAEEGAVLLAVEQQQAA